MSPAEVSTATAETATTTEDRKRLEATLQELDLSKDVSLQTRERNLYSIGVFLYLRTVYLLSLLFSASSDKTFLL